VIRYIDLSEQLEEEFCFAWFDTMTWRFQEYNNIHVWESFKEFESDLLAYLRSGRAPEKMQDEMLGRFRALYPAKQTSPAQSELN
jgi:hypothetical protein